MFMVPKAELRRFANSNHSAANVIVRTARARLARGARAGRGIEAVRGAARARAGLRVEVTGNAVVLNRSADALAGNQLASIALASATIFLLVYAVFRSRALGLLVMIPNVTPVICSSACSAWASRRSRCPTSMIGCVVLGVAVDDTVHTLVAVPAAARGRRARPSTAMLLDACARSAGRW